MKKTKKLAKIGYGYPCAREIDVSFNKLHY